MVVFVCDGCQESLNRGKVKGHLAKCRNAYSLSCVDCGQRFDGDAYEKHITCVSEGEKYAGKRETKQDDWAETVREAVSNIADSGARSGFESMIAKIGESTIPRKKPKFVNMCKSSHGYIRPAAVDAIWGAIEQILKRKAEERERKKIQELAEKLKRQEEAERAAASDQTDDEKTQQRRLRRLLKKAKDHTLSIEQITEALGAEKKVLKRLAKSFPETFEMAKGEDGGRIIKLARRDEDCTNN